MADALAAADWLQPCLMALSPHPYTGLVEAVVDQTCDLAGLQAMAVAEFGNDAVWLRTGMVGDIVPD